MKATSKDTTLLLHQIETIGNKACDLLIEESLKEELKNRITQFFKGTYFKLILKDEARFILFYFQQNIDAKK